MDVFEEFNGWQVLAENKEAVAFIMKEYQEGNAAPFSQSASGFFKFTNEFSDLVSPPHGQLFHMCEMTYKKVFEIASRKDGGYPYSKSDAEIAKKALMEHPINFCFDHS